MGFLLGLFAYGAYFKDRLLGPQPLPADDNIRLIPARDEYDGETVVKGRAASLSGQSRAASPLLAFPPEVRNMIYEELLIFQSDCSWPGILATCKQINQEAAAILYERNTITINITQSGVYVEKLLCRRYQSTQTASPRVLSIKHLLWPKLLHRVRSLEINVPSNFWQYRTSSSRGGSRAVPASIRKAAIANVLYFLSMMSRDKNSHSIRIKTYLGFETCNLQTALYPMRFLGFGGLLLQPRESEDGRALIGGLSDPVAVDWVFMLRSSDERNKTAFLRFCKDIIARVATERTDSSFFRLLGQTLAFTIVRKAKKAARHDLDIGRDGCYKSDRVFTNTLKFLVQDLRILLTEFGLSRESLWLQRQVALILLLDIELHATPAVAHGDTAATEAQRAMMLKKYAKRVAMPHSHMRKNSAFYFVVDCLDEKQCICDA